MSLAIDGTRRTFIRRMGLGAGAGLLSPILGSLIGRAWGLPVVKKRHITYWSFNGITPAQIAGAVRSQRDFDLPESLSGLGRFKDKVNVIRHLKNSSHSFLHGVSYSASTCARVGGDFGPPRGPSMDYLLSQELGKDTRRPLVAIGGTLSSSGSASAGGMGSGLTAWNTLFQGQVVTTAGADAQAEYLRRKKLKSSILDFIAEDIKRSQAHLAGEERAKLDQYVDSIEGLQHQLGIDDAATGKCATPEKPAGGDAAKLAMDAVRVGVTAVACGMTRHLSVGGGDRDGGNRAPRYSSLGVNVGLHALYHGAQASGPCAGICDKAAAGALVTKLLKFHSEQIAYMYGFLQKFPEGNGTMADNTVISWHSDGENHHGAGNRMCSIWLGSAGGALKTGNYVTYPDGQVFLPQMWLTLAKAMGSGMTRFGDGSTPCPGVLPDLLV